MRVGCCQDNSNSANGVAGGFPLDSTLSDCATCSIPDFSLGPVEASRQPRFRRS